MGNKSGPSNTHPTRAATTTSAPKPALQNQGRAQNPPRTALNQQIQGFDKSTLKPPRPQQRFMVSPHNDVNNMMNNLRGFGEKAQMDSNPMVRPVFKDDKQRSAFNDMAQKRLDTLGSADKLSKWKDKRDHATYSQMANWSTKDNAMMNFSNVDKKRSHPVVYVQGHGSPGDKNIYSDSHEKTSANAVGRILKQMDLPKVSEIRANSCFSGTQKKLDSTPDLMQKFSGNTLDLEAGKRSETFAGALDQSINSPGSYKERYDLNKAEVDKIMKRPLGAFGQLKAKINPNNLTQARKDAIDKVDKQRHNRVVGYLGPTTQGPTSVTKHDKLGRPDFDYHQGVKLDKKYVLRSQATSKGPSVPGKK